MRRLRLLRIAVLVLPVFLALYPAQLVAVALHLRLARHVPRLFWRWVLMVAGVRVRLVGELSPSRPLFVCANHTSWLDIAVLTSIAPASFVTKADVAGWPVIGHLARLQRSIFIDRTRRTATAAVNQEIAERLADGDLIVLFPEGTSSSGDGVLPFRASLLGAVREALKRAGATDALTVQPLALVLAGHHGLPMDRRARVRWAWFGDMDLAPHLIDALASGPIEVEIRCGRVMAIDGDHDRKRLARDLEHEVRTMLAAGLTGRGRG